MVSIIFLLPMHKRPLRNSLVASIGGSRVKTILHRERRTPTALFV